MAEFEVIDKAVSERAIAAFDGIKEAIEEMEVPVGNVSVEEYANKIREISVGDKIQVIDNDAAETELQMANYCVDLDYRLLLIEWGV